MHVLLPHYCTPASFYNYLRVLLTPCVHKLFTDHIHMNLVPPIWVSLLNVLLSNDIEINPGDFTTSFFSFCNWNINSLTKDNFHCVHVLDDHNDKFDRKKYFSVYYTEVLHMSTVTLNLKPFCSISTNSSPRSKVKTLFYVFFRRF